MAKCTLLSTPSTASLPSMYQFGLSDEESSNPHELSLASAVALDSVANTPHMVFPASITQDRPQGRPDRIFTLPKMVFLRIALVPSGALTEHVKRLTMPLKLGSAEELTEFEVCGGSARSVDSLSFDSGFTMQVSAIPGLSQPYVLPAFACAPRAHCHPHFYSPTLCITHQLINFLRQSLFPAVRQQLHQEVQSLCWCGWWPKV